jgi:hypothetical protein
MFGVMPSIGGWMLMLHGTVFVQQIVQQGPRGSSQFGSINSGMVNALRGVAGGRLQLRAMGSADVLTVGGKGYPLLLQSGETYRGQPIHDRQHPHDVFMELAVVYDRQITRALAWQLYAAPAGEPALGPVAFPHRFAASADPMATLGHHWQDATHVSFGVLTTGVYSRRVKVEGSVFNGREPDEVRTNLDLGGARLDSYSARVTFNPTSAVTLSASAGRIVHAEPSHDDAVLRRTVLSALWLQPRADSGSRSVAVTLGMNSEAHATASRSMGLEGQLDWRGRTQLFVRAEMVQKTSEDLVLADNDLRHRVGHLSLGAVRERSIGRFGRMGLGARGTLNLVPSSLAAAYGSRHPLSAALYVRWRAPRMPSASMQGMHHAH